MANVSKRPSGVKSKHPGRTLIMFLLLILVMAGTLGFGVFKGYTKPTPNLALDLEGGTQLILTPKATGDKANETPSAQDIAQAIEIIRQRVDASGVSEAEITSQGTSNILVSLPGNPSEETLDLVRQSAELNFRSVLLVGSPLPLNQLQAYSLQSQAASTDSEEDAEQAQQLTEQAQQIAAADPVEYANSQADADGDGVLSDQPATEPENGSDDAWMTEQVMADYYALDCSDAANREGGDSGDPDKAIVACSTDGQQKYILSPVEIAGSHIKSAQSSLGQNSSGQSTGQWVVNLSFDKTGTELFAEVTTRLYGYLSDSDSTTSSTSSTSDKNRFAIVLDGNVVSAPGVNTPITNGSAEISGSFTRQSAQTLANQLEFGSLPLNFEVQSETHVSATLGSEQLKYGIWAGIIGLILVMLYLIWQYRGLSIVAIGSLFSAAAILYLVLTLLSWWMGYRLSLAGVAGVIISIGTTADSFIVYFERIRDEVRDGRPLVAAVEEGWRRAKRTIVTSDAVNILAAAVLYALAVGGVQGFAFTLGVTTLIDLFIIFWFTHPLMVKLLRFKFFSEGHKLSGLDPVHLGAQRGTYRYQGAGKVRKIKSVYKSRLLAGSEDTDKTAEKDQDASSLKQSEVSEETPITAAAKKGADNGELPVSDQQDSPDDQSSDADKQADSPTDDNDQDKEVR